MKIVVAVIAVVLLVTGCAKPLEVSSITRIKPTNGATGVDVYAEQRSRGEKVPEYAGDQLLQVRSYSVDEDGAGRKEFAGADCTVSASNFTAVLRTPAKLRVPIYRSKSSSLSVKCSHPSHKPKLIDVAVYNKTQSDRLKAGANGGLAGVIVMAAVNGLSDAALDNYYYAPANVVMTKLPKRSLRRPN